MRKLVAQSLILLLAVGCAEQLPETPMAGEPTASPPTVPGLFTETGRTSDLRMQMSDVVSQARPFLDLAEAMKGRKLPRGQRINQEACDSVEEKIAAANSGLVLVMCRDDAGLPRVKGGAKVFFSEDAGLLSQQGLRVSFMLQSIEETVRETFHVASAYSMESILLDSEYRIIEKSQMIWEGKGRVERPISYRIFSIDTEGNRYEHHYQTDGKLSIARFTSSDGNAVFTRSLRPRSARARARDANSVLVQSYEITSEGGYDRMSVYSVNGLEVCTEGSSLSGKEWTGYPSATATHGLCSNDW